ncbi:MAG: hypothetical protein OSB75_10780, partial [Dehalococcoidia bacterium]|nr:hypothetical protein [Dehalococcoidia bacterium]
LNPAALKTTDGQLRPGAASSIPSPGFGSSDCHCSTYLVRVNNLQEVRMLLRSLSSDQRRIRLRHIISE